MKQICKFVTGILILIIILGITIVSAQASSISFTASLTAVNENIVAGEQVNFNIHIVNTGDYEIGYFAISTMRGGTIKSASITVPPGGDVDLSFYLTIDTTGEIAYQFRVYGFNGNDSDTIITNAVTITVTFSPTSTPQTTAATTLEPTPIPTPTPTETPTHAPTLTPTQQSTDTPMLRPSPTAAPQQTETMATYYEEQDSASLHDNQSHTTLYIILGIIGAINVATLVLVVLGRHRK